MVSKTSFAIVCAVFAVFFFVPAHISVDTSLFQSSAHYSLESLTAHGQGTQLQNPIRFNRLDELVRAVLDAIIQVAVPIAAVFLIYSGFLFVFARGDETKLKTAKSVFLWTIVGIAVLLGAELLSQVIKGTIDQIRR